MYISQRIVDHMDNEELKRFFELINMHNSSLEEQIDALNEITQLQQRTIECMERAKTAKFRAFDLENVMDRVHSNAEKKYLKDLQGPSKENANEHTDSN